MKEQIVSDLEGWHNPTGVPHYCHFAEGGWIDHPCGPYIITEGRETATVACPDTGNGYVYQRIKGGWVQV